MAADKGPGTPEQILEGWLSNMDNAFAYFSMQTGLSLDFTPASLDGLEAWLLNRYPNSAAITRPSEEDYLDCAARYVGETLRQHLGGHWELRFDDPSNVHYGIPRLTGLHDGGPPIAPQIEITTCLARRTGHYFSNRLAKRKA